MTSALGSDKIHRSKRDTWLMVVLAAAGLLSLTVTVVTFLTEPGGGRALLVLFFAVYGFILWTVVGTFYVVTETALLVRSGPFRWQIPLSKIRQVLPTRNPLSSPALSLDRLEIRHGFGSLMISPEDKRAFLRDLVERTPGLVLEGEGAVRRG